MLPTRCSAEELPSPKLSVIVPILQSAPILALFLKSLRETLPEGNQLILVDDGCGLDASDLIEQSRPALEAKFDLHLIRHSTPRGDGAACNEALPLANNAISVRLESDAIMLDNWTSAIAKPFKDERVAATAGVLLYPQTNGINHAGLTFYGKVARHTFLNAAPDALPEHPFPVQCATFGFTAFRNSAFRQAGGFDELYHQGYDDLDLALRMIRDGGQCLVAPAARAYHWEFSSGPHRIAGRKRNLAVFWDRWGKTITDDLWTYVERTLKTALTDPLNAASRGRIAVDLHSDRVSARRFWKEAQRYGLVVSEMFDLAHRAADDGPIALPLVLGADAFDDCSQFIFLVDNFVRLRGNHYFFERRARIGMNDLIIDFHGNVVPAKALHRAAWPGEKIR